MSIFRFTDSQRQHLIRLIAAEHERFEQIEPREHSGKLDRALEDLEQLSFILTVEGAPE